jgi:hypothetical protein
VESHPISSIEFALTENDFVSLGEFTMTKSRFFRRKFITIRLFNFFIPPFGIVLADALHSILHNHQMALTHGGYPPILLGGGIVFGCLWGMGEWIYRLARIRRAVSRRLRDGTHTKLLEPGRVELLPEGIRHTGEFGTSLTPWSAIIDVINNKTAAYIYITSVAALIIPRRAFVNEASYDDFVGEVVKHRGEYASSRP